MHTVGKEFRDKLPGIFGSAGQREPRSGGDVRSQEPTGRQTDPRAGRATPFTRLHTGVVRFPECAPRIPYHSQRGTAPPIMDGAERNHTRPERLQTFPSGPAQSGPRCKPHSRRTTENAARSGTARAGDLPAGSGTQYRTGPGYTGQRTEKRRVAMCATRVLP